jgi:hypothetical protein
MQLMQSTLRRKHYIPVQSLLAGAQIKPYFNGNMPLILTAHNARPKAVNNHHIRIPLFIETRLYVPQVLGIYKIIKYSELDFLRIAFYSFGTKPYLKRPSFI